ncbi:MAG: F0F1 ATP synthase subunit epsilon [Bacteroidales bacterium]|nr:F0F1 ATP synthase subunit epsilon [Bacteroidales bacterium]
MKVEIISPSETLYSGEATAVTVPSQMGPFTLLEHHAAIVAILEAGKVSLTEANDEQKEFAIKGGFVENHNNLLTICVEL